MKTTNPDTLKHTQDLNSGKIKWHGSQDAHINSSAPKAEQSNELQHNEAPIVTETNTDAESPKGLDYVMYRLKKDIKFLNSLFEIDKKAGLKNPLYEGSMRRHEERTTELTLAHEDIKHPSDVKSCEGNVYLFGEITAYAYMVRNGKPAALISIQTRYVDAAIEIIEGYKLSYHHAHLADGWVEMWMYKNPTMKEIIECLPNTPTTDFDHWVLGKVFGYSDMEIFTFISKQKLKLGTDHD